MLEFIKPILRNVEIPKMSNTAIIDSQQIDLIIGKLFL